MRTRAIGPGAPATREKDSSLSDGLFLLSLVCSGEAGDVEGPHAIYDGAFKSSCSHYLIICMLL